MSLLMDALKKAELAKRQNPQNQPAPSAVTPSQEAMELAPIGAGAEPFAGEAPAPPPVVETDGDKGRGLPDLPSRLELLDQEFMDEALARRESKREPAAPAKGSRLAPLAEPGPAQGASMERPARPPRGDSETQRERESVQNLFEAKQTSASASRTAFALVIGLSSLLAAAAIGIYFWLQLQPTSNLLPARGAIAPLAAPPPAAPQFSAIEPAAVAPLPMMEEAEPEPEPAPPAAQPVEIPIRVTTSRPRVDPDVVKAYDALQGGDLNAAKLAYERSLKNDPRNADALHGLAATLLRQGRPDLAEEYYLRALESDPKDALAQASLIGLSGKIDPLQSESRLKLLLAAQPESAFLHFYLGNLYARQKRWAEAQQSYFRAMTGEPDNPDYLFNLAVSLDQLHQARPAAQYYAQSLAAADKRPAGFNRQEVADRLKQLQP